VASSDPEKQEQVMRIWMGWPDWTPGWGGGLMNWYVTVHAAWYAFVIGIAVLMAVVIMKRTGSSGAGAAALDILRVRYARGELSKADFDRMRRDIAA